MACKDKPASTSCFDEAYSAEGLADRDHKYVEVRVVDLVDGKGVGRKSRGDIEESIAYLNTQFGDDFTFYLPEDGIALYSDDTLFHKNLTVDDVLQVSGAFYATDAVTLFFFP